LKHLRAFYLVAQEGSMKKAAEGLLRSPSSVAHAVQSLEAALEVALFDRGVHGMSLNEPGQQLMVRLGQAWEEMEQAKSTLQHMAASRGKAVGHSPLFHLSISDRRLALMSAFSERRHAADVAALLGITQPAVSAAIRELDHGLSLPLFDRSSHGMRLTPAGEIMLLHLKRAVQIIRLAEAEITEAQGKVAGTVAVGNLPFGRAYLLPAAINALHERYPAVTVRTVEGRFDVLLNALWCGDVDFIVGALPAIDPAHYPGLEGEKLFDDTVTVMVSAGHPLAGLPQPALADTCAYPWVLPVEGSPIRELMKSAFQEQGLSTPNVVVDSADLTIIRGLLLNQQWVTAASRHLYHHEIHRGVLTPLTISLPKLPHCLGILRPGLDRATPAAKALMAMLRCLRTQAPA